MTHDQFRDMSSIFPGFAMARISSVGWAWPWHHASCRDAEPQYHRKVNNELEFYFCRKRASNVATIR